MGMKNLIRNGIFHDNCDGISKSLRLVHVGPTSTGYMELQPVRVAGTGQANGTT